MESDKQTREVEVEGRKKVKWEGMMGGLKNDGKVRRWEGRWELEVRKVRG